MTHPIIVLPMPPSANNLFATVGRKRVASADYKAWKTEAGYALNAAGKWRIGGPVVVTVTLPVKMRGDIDNRVKPVLDLLVAHDRIDDDRNVQCLHVFKCREDGKAGVSVSSMLKREASLK